MVPLVRYSSVAGIPLADLMDADTLQQIVTRTRGAAPRSSSISRPAAPTMRPRRPPSRWWRPYSWTASGCCLLRLPGRRVWHPQPVRRRARQARARGIEKIFEAKLTEEELAALHKSAAAVKELVDVMAPKLS